jgi:hypothetical protein
MIQKKPDKEGANTKTMKGTTSTKAKTIKKATAKRWRRHVLAVSAGVLTE